MKETLEKIVEKVTDFFFNLNKKFDKLSDQLYQRTATKVNIGLIFYGTILFIILFIFVRAFLNFLWGLIYY